MSEIEQLRLALSRAFTLLNHSRFLANCELGVPACQACDPGGEGAELAHYHIQDIDAFRKEFEPLLKK